MSDPILDANADLWVFGYGSLMWRPGFDFAERHLARVNGLHRSLCVYSHVHRGTPERPGLVLGLDLGGSCRGIAYRVPAAARRETVAYLRAREQVTAAYLEIVCTIHLADGRTERALAYRVDRQHLQYAGRLPEGDIIERVRNGVGVSGANPDYVTATADHLTELGIHDRVLAHVAAALRRGAGPG